MHPLTFNKDYCPARVLLIVYFQIYCNSLNKKTTFLKQKSKCFTIFYFKKEVFDFDGEMKEGQDSAFFYFRPELRLLW